MAGWRRVVIDLGGPRPGVIFDDDNPLTVIVEWEPGASIHACEQVSFPTAEALAEALDHARTLGA